MKIEFYKPNDEIIPTGLRLMIEDGENRIQVYYSMCQGEFAYDFQFYNCPEGKEQAYLDQIANIMCMQSYDHGSEWRKTKSELIKAEDPLFGKDTYRIYFRRKDSY